MKNIGWFCSMYIIAAAFSISSCSDDAEAEQVPPGEEVKIGDQIWATRNLNVTSFRSGDQIPEAKTAAEWQAAATSKTPAWCYFHDRSDQAEKTGKLYNYYAVNNAKGIAPLGWHVPSADEWHVLCNTAGGDIFSAAPYLRSKTGWATNDNNNASGFFALPVGVRDADGTFGEDNKSLACWWTSSQTAFGHQTQVWMVDGFNTVHLMDVDQKGYGYTVRLIKD